MRMAVAASLLSLLGCASYGLHHPARVLDQGQSQVGISLDLLRFWSRLPDADRPSDRLDAWTLLPTLTWRRGLGWHSEVELSLLPVGLRAGARFQALGDPTSRGAVAAEVGLTVAGGLGQTTDFSPVLMPDAALSAGWSPAEQAELSLSARYLWLRGSEAGSGFDHAFGLTLGGWGRMAPVEGGVEVSALRSPASEDWIFAPGGSVGLGVGK